MFELSISLFGVLLERLEIAIVDFGEFVVIEELGVLDEKRW